MKTVKIKFVSEAGKNFYVSMDYAAPSLTEPEGAAKVQTAADLILEKQPFAAVLLSCESAELIDRTSTPIEISQGA